MVLHEYCPGTSLVVLLFVSPIGSRDAQIADPADRGVSEIQTPKEGGEAPKRGDTGTRSMRSHAIRLSQGCFHIAAHRRCQLPTARRTASGARRTAPSQPLIASAWLNTRLEPERRAHTNSPPPRTRAAPLVLDVQDQVPPTSMDRGLVLGPKLLQERIPYET